VSAARAGCNGWDGSAGVEFGIGKYPEGREAGKEVPQGKRRDPLLRQAVFIFVEFIFVKDFAGRILTFDESAARVFAVIATRRRAQGQPIHEPDAQIAAIARADGATLATRNTDNFKGCGVRLINPWRE